MLCGEMRIDVHALKDWVADLACPHQGASVCPALTQEYDDVLESHFELYKQAVDSLQVGDDWYKVRWMLSPALINALFKAPFGAVRIANYYECLVAPSDEQTRKRITAGFGTHTESSEIPIIKNGTAVGCIGTKSDLIWEAYYDYFVVEDEFGNIEHTMANHEELLSLQLWDNADLDEHSIRKRVDTLLVELSMQSGLNFKRITPNELWTSPGECGRFELIDEGKRFESIPLAYFSCAIVSADPRMAYLHYYQVLEFFYVRAQNVALIAELGQTGVLSKTPIEHNALREVLAKYARTRREEESLKLVLGGCVDPDGIRTWIRGDQSLQYTYAQCDRYGSEAKLKLESTDDKLLGSLARRIYFFRCSIAHSKGDAGEFAARPMVHDEEIGKELPLLRRVAYDALEYWSYR